MYDIAVTPPAGINMMDVALEKVSVRIGNKPFKFYSFAHPESVCQDDWPAIRTRNYAAPSPEAANNAATFAPRISASRWSIANDGLALSFSNFETKLSEHLAASATCFKVSPRTMRACLSRAPILTSLGAPEADLWTPRVRFFWGPSAHADDR